MKRNPRVSLSSAMKKSFLSFSALFLVLSVFGANALATTPIAVDIYQDMESGNNGDVLTPSIMNASSHGAGGWSAPSGTMWVSTGFHRDLPGPVLVGSTTYNGTGGSRSWRFVNSSNMQFVQQSSGSFPELTVACYYCPTCTLTWSYGYDTICLWGGSFAIMQTLTGSSGPYYHCHSKTGNNVGTNDDPTVVNLTSGKTYWVNLKFSGTVAQVHFAAFDPDNGYAQVGTTLQVISIYNDTAYRNTFGRADNHGDQSSDTNSYYFNHILFDYTNSAFPLLPSGCNDTTAPSAPIVRDGTGQEQSIAISTTKLSANWEMAVDNESGIKGYQYAIGASLGGTDVVNWTTMKNILGVTKTGLSLTTGQTYYFSVKAINGAGLTGPATNSIGQTVGTDTTAPSAPAGVRDGGWYNYNPDSDEATSTTELYCNWDPATDNESGISYYQYAFGTTPGGTNTLNWSNFPASILNARGYGMNGWATSGSGTGVTLTPGTRYYATVRAVNNAGIVGPATNSNGLVCVNSSDTTVPSAPPTVRDGTASTETSTTASTTQLSANWDNSTDNESGISGYYYAIGTTLGGSNIVGDTRVTYGSPVSSITRTGLSLTLGQTYYFRIKAINGVGGNGLTGPATNSSGVTIVIAGPQPPSAPPHVRDGTGATEMSYTTSTTELSANWDAATDPVGSVTAYQYAIGTSAGGTQTVNWTVLGNVTTMTKTGLSLTSGQTYYFSVYAVNNLGLAGNATNSNGQTVDTTSPGPGAVRDGTGADIATTTSMTQLSANWDAAVDAESGISGYQYAIGTSVGGTQVANWTSLGNVTTVTQTGLTLTAGQIYYFSIKAVNGVGLTGSATNSDGQTAYVDTTPPSAPPTVRDGTGADISTTGSTNHLSANWDASTDNDSGISGYQYAIGSAPGGTQIANWTSLGNVTTVTRTGLSLVAGTTYYFSVRAINGYGLTGNATNSDGQTGTVTYTVYFSDNFESWTAHGGAWSSVIGESATHSLDTSTDYAKAGIKGLKITDSDTTATSGATLVENFSPVISGGIYVRFFVYLPTAYISANAGSASRRLLRIWCGSNRGQISLALSATPLMEEVGGWGAAQASSALSANTWHCIEIYSGPPSASTPMQYWVDGTSTGTLNGSYGTSTTYNKIEFGDASLGGGVNAMGTFYLDELIVANMYIDPTPPSAPANVRDGTGADISTTGSATQLSANWDAATDADSGISGYQYAIGTSAGGTQILNWTSLGNVTTVTQTGLSLVVGQTYYFSVLAVNGIGATSSATNSNGQTVQAPDSTPPSAPANVRDGTGADIATTGSTTQLSANWDAATDAESGISGYQYAIGTTAGGTQILNWTSLGNVTTVTQTGLSLVVGQTYYFSVMAVNTVGLTGSATNSNGQTVVDMTPPTVTSTAVNGANGAGTQRSMVNSLVVTFSKIATLDEGAFAIVNKATLAFVTVAVSADSASGQTIATLTFSGDQTQYGSLIDGNYQLTIDATKVHDSTSGVNMASNYVFGTVTGDNFFRLFGDADGSRRVDNTDFSCFALSMGKRSTDAGYLWYMDVNSNNRVDNTDFSAFGGQMNKRMQFQ